MEPETTAELRPEPPFDCEQARILSIDVEKRRVTHVISTGRLDRGGRMVDVAGWKLGNFKRAPRVLADHDYSIERVIGRGIDTHVDGDSLISTTEFGTSELANAAWELARTGLVNTWSVGWIGLKAHAVGELDDCQACQSARAKLGKNGYGRHYTEQELLEYSLVAIPANPDAVMHLQAAGLVWSRALAREPEREAELIETVAAEPPARSSAFADELFKLARDERRRASALQIGAQLGRLRS